MSPLERTPSYTAPGERQSTQPLAEPQLIQLADDAAHCQRCPLYRNATQAVFGEGPIDAALFLVGEQPGDQEDREGRPFVGPAGRILDLALEKAGLDRRSIYVTNAVKHFKHEQRGNDWRNAFVGVILGYVLTAALPPDSARDMLFRAIGAIGHFFWTPGTAQRLDRRTFGSPAGASKFRGDRLDDSEILPTIMHGKHAVAAATACAIFDRAESFAAALTRDQLQR